MAEIELDGLVREALDQHIRENGGGGSDVKKNRWGTLGIAVIGDGPRGFIDIEVGLKRYRVPFQVKVTVAPEQTWERW